MVVKSWKRALMRVLPRAFVMETRAALYRGSRFSCVVCGRSFRKGFEQGYDYQVLKDLVVVGGMRKENDECPYCRANDRTRLIYLYLKYHSDFFESSGSLLHIAPESGLSAIFSTAPSLHYVPSDLDHARYQHIENLQSFDIQSIPEKSDKYDWVICNHVLEHVPDDRKAMSEIFRVLKPGGHAILQVPVSLVLTETREGLRAETDEDRIRLYGQFDHVRLYARDYYERLRGAGFQVDLWNAYDADPARASAYNLNPLENLCVASKLAKERQKASQ